MILNSDGKKYGETDTLKIRSFLSMLARIEIDINSKQKV